MFKIKLSLFLFSTILLFSSCVKDGFDHFNNLASLSTFNAMPASKGFDVYIDNNRLNNYAENFDFGTFINYQSIFPGRRQISIVRPGTGRWQPLLSKVLEFNEKKYYTLMITGNQDLEYLLTEDDIKTPEKGKVRIRLVHLSPDSPDISLQLAEETPQEFSKLTYKNVSKFIEIDAGTLSATINSSDDDFEPMTFNFNFLDQATYTVFVRGLSKNEEKSKSVTYSVVRY